MRTIIINNPGPQGAVGPQGNAGPTGSSQPFSNVSGSIWATTSNLEVTGSFTNLLPTNLKIQSNLSSSFSVGATYVNGVGWPSLVFSGSQAAFRSDINGTFVNGLNNGRVHIPAFGLSFPYQGATQTITTGSDFVFIGTQYTDSTAIGGSPQLNAQQSAILSGSYGYNEYLNQIAKNYNTGESSLNIQKRNNAGETITLNLNSGNDGFSIFSTLSQPTSSFLRLVSGSSNNLVDFRYDANYIQQNTIIGSGPSTSPTSRLQVRGSGATSSTTALRVENTNTSASLVVLDNGNTLIGTSTDSGFKLDVNGTAKVSGVLYAGNTATSGYLADLGGITNGMVFQNAGVTNRTQLKGFSSSTETFRVDVANGAMFGAGSLDASAQVTINSTTKGVLIPRMTTTERDAISSPATGLQIFNTTDGYHEFYDAFWGWMPIANQNEWKQKYGFEIFNDGCQSDGFFGAGAFGTGQGNAGANILGFTYGNITFVTGTTTSSGYRLMSNSFLALGGGNTRFTAGCTFAQLSTLADRYYINVGFHDVFGLNQTDAVCFVYDEGGLNSGSTASGNWQCLTASNNVRTWTTTSVPVNAFRNLRIDINADGTQALFYINEVLVATHTTNIPTGTARNTQCGASMVKATGTTSLQTIILDYIGLKMKLTTPRT